MTRSSIGANEERASLLIGGERRDPAAEAWAESLNPADQEIVGWYPLAGEVDVQRAIDSASEAFRRWSRSSVAERASVLRRAGDVMLERIEKYATLITREQGKTLSAARGEVQSAASFCHWFAEEARRAYGDTIPDPDPQRRMVTVREPVGVVAVITPWNVAFSQMARKTAPALAAGCTVVAKPASQTSLVGLAAAEPFLEAGVPPGVVNVVTGDPARIGRVLMGDSRVRKISFTGSTDVGKLLMRQAADDLKRLSLELGGNAPVLVFDDADIEHAARDVAALKFRNSGQACISANRVLVQEGVADRFVELLAAHGAELRMGNGMEPGVDLGPLIDRDAVDRVRRLVSDATERGARLMTDGDTSPEAQAQGWFYPPTVLDRVSGDAAILQEEIFGPVAPVLRFETEEEAVLRANETQYGLAAYLYTENLSRAWRIAESLECGMVGINDQRISVVEAPFGGVKHSGLGREGGHQGLAEYQNVKLIALGVR